ncbi:MFS transporter, MHS family, proline/betaine transporter [Marinobacter antarcticus]|uniref:MFS transporter, MHS family, proline/betaine transporter n=1 Tax=Marinobacter antarcticus TaxID=564117 RepID=A0A1M6R966_9GAMM|nr:MFS transporter [Marinobacter antarcticus]SHK28980.1 MFS transporter, MHS family, proline/betaine transporter [Marinobacter antarcticus]
MAVGKRHTALLAGFIGNVVEWYDFALYGYMAGILATLFFPSESQLASLIATYGVFAAGFFMRPLGAGLFGWLGDTVGRTKTMMVSVMMMALPTVLLGCLPTYDTAGIWAPILLIVIRLVQGLSVGGEFSSSVVYLVETAPDGKRGYSGSWANTGSMVGMLLGAGVAAVATSLLSEEALHAWGWRLPFLIGGLIGLVAILLRRNLPESKHFNRHLHDRSQTSPLLQAFTTDRLKMIKGIMFASAYGVIFYLPLVYLPEWLHLQTGMPRDKALQINTAATALLLVLIPFVGLISDRFIRRTHFIAGAMLVMALVSYPFYTLLANDGWWGAVVVQFVLAILLAVPLGAAPALFVELFPARDRLSGYSIAYNLGLGIVGGATPMVATWLIKESGSPAAPAFLLTAAAVLAFAAVLWIRDGSREPLLD